jgi:mRNA interferase MazF
MAEAIHRGDVFLVRPDPARGDEIRKIRPCVIVSPDELNAHLRTFIVAPLATGSHPYPYRSSCRFEGRAGCVVLDQIRTIDHNRLVRRLGKLSSSTLAQVLAVLQQMFAP